METEALIVEIKQKLNSAFAKLDEWFGAPESLRAFRPGNGGWTINEILEHVALTNHYLLILIEKGAAKAAKNINNLNLATELTNYQFERAKLDEIGQHKSFEWMRPEHMEPRGTQTVTEVAQTLRKQLEQCEKILQQLPNGEGVLYRITMSVNDLGKINVYELVYFLAKHAERHLTQIEQVAVEYRALNY
jgi:hypothetical protein